MKKKVFLALLLSIVLTSCGFSPSSSEQTNTQKAIGGESSGLFSNSGSNAE